MTTPSRLVSQFLLVCYSCSSYFTPGLTPRHYVRLASYLCHCGWPCGTCRMTAFCCGFSQDKSWRVRYMVADKFCEVNMCKTCMHVHVYSTCIICVCVCASCVWYVCVVCTACSNLLDYSELIFYCFLSSPSSSPSSPSSCSSSSPFSLSFPSLLPPPLLLTATAGSRGAAN